MGGGMEVHKNKWIEEWNAGRENLEFNFRWTRRSLAVVGLFGLAVPILVYKGIVREFVIPSPNPLFIAVSPWLILVLTMNLPVLVWLQHMQDEDAGRPYRKFL
ncbi:hypothetical protein E2562_032358 [Oryza meyeriana var. granulata]|uniref:Uncharacterized protein n=1 Tax=Oryza meyeriana var. granulata TaxID=110450 RepID=A0A6G1E5W6_9ORYZ|nr:hypothetical protein E2562_032358 [Oryza meyeriana var. granulata]